MKDHHHTDLVSLLEYRAALDEGAPLYSFLNSHGECTVRLTFGDVYSMASRIAIALQQSGLYGKPVALLYLHGADFVIGFWGCVLAGAWPLPLTKGRGQSPENVAAILKRSCVSHVLGSEALLAQLPPDIKRYSNPQLFALANESMFVRPVVLSRAGDNAFIQYTSGSTSDPKGVVISHANVMDNLARITLAFGCGENDTGLSWLPFHHDMGLVGHILQPVYAGIHNYFMPPGAFLARPARWLEVISRYDVTISGAPNFAYRLCVNRIQPKDLPVSRVNLDSWRVAYCGSEKINATTLTDFAGKFSTLGFSPAALRPCYGLAESTLFVSGRQGVKLPAKSHAVVSARTPPISVGTVDTSVRIVDPVSREECTPGVAGEIWIASLSVADEYFLDQKKTSETFGQRLPGSGMAFMRSGDLGFIEDGELYVIGRLKNVIKVRGRPLYAEDIELALERSGDSLGLTRAVALPIDVDGCEALGILVECSRRREAAKTSKLIVSHVTEHVCAASGVLPSAVVVVAHGQLPLTTSGKVRRSECQKYFTD